MNHATIQFFSPALERHVTYNVILPAEGGPGPFPAVLQLHGYNDNQSGWLINSNLVRHARPYGMLIVVPDGGTSWWLNAGKRERYEDFLMQDLMQHVSDTFHVRPGPWAIGGLSMGGYGALRLASKYPERFASVWSHSSAFLHEPEWLQRLGAHACTPELLADADIWAATERLAGAAARPLITFDCGADDFFVSHNREMHAHLQRLGVAHAYHEHPGDHTWDYWDEHVQAALAQHARVLSGLPQA